MKKEQLYKLLKVALITTIVMLVFEVIFSFKAITGFFTDLIYNSSGWVVYAVIWLIMMLQCTILNIPAYVILVACANIGIEILSLKYIAVVLSAYMVGCIIAYGIGRKWGVKAVKWCSGSEEDFNKWCNFINVKGKWFYLLTILLPVFPDDLLCIVVGSTKFNFGTYTIFNLIGRGIGLTTMCAVLKFIGSIGGGFPFMIIVWAVAIILEIILLAILKNRLTNDLK